MRFLAKTVKDHKGQTMVEFALVLPLLLILLMGTIESGRILYSYLIITNAAREGARAGAVGHADSEIISKIETAAGSLDRSSLSISISPVDPASRTRGVPLTVSLDYTVDLVVPLIAAIIPDPFPLAITTTMRIE